MKKIVSVILLVAIILSCFITNASAASACYKCYRQTTTRYSHQKYTTGSHLRITYESCSYCGSSREVSRTTQACSDRDNNKLCDWCGNLVSSSSPSNPSTPSQPACDHDKLLLDVSDALYYYNSDLNHEVNIIAYCDICYEIVGKKYYEPHIDRTHDKVCDKCRQKFTNSTEHTGKTFSHYEYVYINDLKLHRISTYSKCDICEQPYYTSYDLGYHEDSDRNRICDLCETEIDHQEHFDKDNDQICDFCGETHHPKHYDKNSDEICDFCEEIYHPKHFDYNYDDECDFCQFIMRTYTAESVLNVKYKEKAYFRVVSKNLPENARIALYSYNNQVTPLATSSDGRIEWISDALTQKTVYVVKLIDENGDTIINSSKIEKYNIIINVNSSFFTRLASFFRELFGADMVKTLGTLQADY